MTKPGSTVYRCEKCGDMVELGHRCPTGEKHFGCNDGNCWLRDNKGMVTNGRCHCLDDLRRFDYEMFRAICRRILELKRQREN